MTKPWWECDSVPEPPELGHALAGATTFATGLVHDFNNLLAGIIGCAEHALMELPPDNPARADIEQIRRAALGGAVHIRQLRDFGRSLPNAPEVFALDAVVRSSETLLSRLLGADIEMCLELGAGDVSLRGDPAELERILMNLAINARRAMPGGGKLTLRTWAEPDADAPALVSTTTLAPARCHAVLSVEDTGCGMDGATIERVFEPYFTTSIDGAGTGVGLCTVQQLVQRSGGRIDVRSQIAEGTCFTLRWPCTEEALSERGASSRESGVRVAQGAGETIMLVEDEALVVFSVQHELQAAGYRVLVARNGQEALLAVERYRGAIDLVLTDIVLPHGISGRQVAEAATRLRPGTAIVYMSALPGDLLAQRGLLDPGVGSLEKPFARDRLLACIAQSLQKTRQELRRVRRSTPIRELEKVM